MNLNKIYFSCRSLSLSRCFSFRLTACLCMLNVYAFSMYIACVCVHIYIGVIWKNVIYSKTYFLRIFIWFARRPLVITLLSLLLSLDYFHFRCCCFPFLCLSLSRSFFIFRSHLFISFWLMVKIAISDSLLMRFFCHLLLLMFMNLLFLCDTNDDFWLNETNERTLTERDMIRI